MIKPTDPFPKQAKDVDLNVVQAFDEVVNLTLDQHTDAVKPFQELKDPPQGWPLRGLVDLGRHACVVSGSLLAQATLRYRIDQQRYGHL